MRERIKNKLLSGDFWKRILYTACFFFFCVIEQREKNVSWVEGWPDVFRDLTGVTLALLILSHYGLKDIRKWKWACLGWTVVWILGMPFLLSWGRNHWIFFNDWIVITLNIILYGYIILFTVIRVFLEKRRPRLNGRYFALWIVMMAWMIFSRSDSKWPLYYFIMFLCFYLTDYSQKERDQMYLGMLDGMILGFFVIQGLGFVFRPFDGSARYRGMFANSNWNALFYLEILAAVLARIVRAAKDGARKWLKAYYWVGAGTVLSFEFLTIGRSGWLTAMVMIGIFLKFLGRTRAAGKWIHSLLLLSVCALLTFPLCFSAARYLPPVFHHPVWYQGEWNEQRVHSWDPWDSEKFVDIDEFLDAALGRVTGSFRNLWEHSPFAINADAAELSDEAPGETAEEVETLPPNKIPVLKPEQGEDGFLVRSTIYQYYFKHLNLFGHPEEEQGFQLLPYYWIGHAHNIFLQYGTDFGIPVMILLAVLVVGGAISLWKRSEKSFGSAETGYCLYLLIPVVFGMFEYSWGVGSLSITMLLIAFGKVICVDE